MSVTYMIVGATTSTGATVKATVTGTQARLAVSTDPGLNSPTFFGPGVATTEGVATVAATGLIADTQYYYAIEDDGTIDTAITGKFRTHPDVGSHASFKLAVSSCAEGRNYPGVGDNLLSMPPADVRVSNHPIFDDIREFNPLAFVHLGDAHYYNIGQFILDTSIATYRHAIDDVLTQPRQHQVYRDIPLVYVWDDHDFGPNNSDGTLAYKANPAQVYRERIPSYPLIEATGPLYHSFEIGRVLFIVSDTRYNRDPSSDPQGPTKTMLGAAQKTWMQGVLAASTAEFFVWLNPTPWMGLSDDTWNGYHDERDEIRDMLRTLGWEDRMWCIGGDSHSLSLDVGVGNADHTGATFPVVTLGSIDSITEPGVFHPSDHYDSGVRVGSGQWGGIEINDQGFVLSVTVTGYDDGQVWKSHTLRVLTSTPFTTTFPSDPAPWLIEIAPGADPASPASWVWEDITAHVRVGGSDIQIGYGRADEWGTTSPTTCDLTVDNRDGRFSPRNPLGPYYGLIDRNTPLRVSWAGVFHRFLGYVTEWPSRWDQSGNDAWVPIRASGILRRLSQGQKALKSSIHREIVSPERLRALAYWPCEDGERAAVISSAIEGSPPMTIRGTPDFGAYSDYPASEPLLVLRDARLSGDVPHHEATGQAIVRMFVHVPAAGSVDGKSLLTIQTGGTIRRWEIHYTTGGGLRFLAYDAEGIEIHGTSVGFNINDVPTMFSFEMTQNGANVDYHFISFEFTANFAEFTDPEWEGSVAGTLGAIRSVIVNENFAHETVAVGHITVGDDIGLFTGTAQSMLAHIGEPAAERIARLCGEEGIPVVIRGDATETATMGPQQSATLLELLRDAETADGGVLHELDAGLAYQARADRYNRNVALTLTQSAGELAAAPEPVDDDQNLRNEVSAKRDGGSSVRVVDQASIAKLGRYDEEVTMNVERDEQLADVAGWRVHLGTVDEMRWPSISLDLSRNPHLIDDWLQFELGDRIALDHSIAQLPGVEVEQHVEGWTEVLNLYSWQVELSCAPATPWDTATIEGTTYGRIDTDGAALDVAIDTTTTGLVVASTVADAPVWTTDVAEMPIDLRLGGEVVQATAVADALTDTFTRTVAPGGWGTSDSGTVWATTGGTATEYQVISGAGQVDLDTIEDRRFTHTGDYGDVDIYCDVIVPAIAAGGSISAGIVTRWTDVSNFYLANLFHRPEGDIFLMVFKRTDFNFFGITSKITDVTYTFDVPTHVRFQCIGDLLRAKVWADGDTEPNGWTVTGNDVAHPRGAIGTHSNLNTGNTNTQPVPIRYDNLRLANPQRMTVVRSVNGITKAHAVGADIRLAHPAILAQ